MQFGAYIGRILQFHGSASNPTSPPRGATAPSRPGPPHSWGFTITDTNTTFGPTTPNDWSARRRDVWQHTILTRDRQQWPQWNSNPQSQQTNSRRPTPQTERPLRSALLYFNMPMISDQSTHPLSVGTRFMSGDTSEPPNPPWFYHPTNHLV